MINLRTLENKFVNVVHRAPYSILKKHTYIFLSLAQKILYHINKSKVIIADHLCVESFFSTS